MQSSSITDSPRNVSNGEKDNFGIEPFEQGLTDFINGSNTPITIALQGEWGSGKTSLMNSLKRNLSDLDNSQYHGIWLNTWEYSLMKDPQSTLMDIISGLIEETSEIANIDDAKTKKILNTLWSGVKDTSKIVAKNALDNQLAGAGTIVDVLSSSSKSSISKVRQELENVIEQCITKHNKRGFVFFIDDLDRIDPPVAVELLELLKNIFTLKHCVFVLAIDYDVVVKGLEPKFGKLSATNEREFRSFFDKIIQVPFAMPVSNYITDDFLKQSLLATNYIQQETADDIETISKFAEIANLSVGKNPRALKRLMNSLSLISCINRANNHSEDDNGLKSNLELLVNFALVSIQIAYPRIYRLLATHCAFDEWDESIAIQLNLKTLDKEQVEKLKLSEEFDEEWELILFRLCEKDHYLKKRALNISRLLNLVREIIQDSKNSVDEVIESIVSLSSVTNIDSEEQAVDKKLSPKKERYLAYFQGMLKELEEEHQFSGFGKARGRNWHNLKSDIPNVAKGIIYVANFPRNQVRAEFHMGTPSAEVNNAFFDALYPMKDEIEKEIGFELSWERQGHTRISRVAVYRDGSIEDSDKELLEIKNWHVSMLCKLREVFNPRVSELRSVYPEYFKG